ncbi:MAG TPA: threonine ammonia-lyase [Candidatus Thermoplasmatota archaeon]|nr:threonine ammonia-lyase [Candidatus Thermoplasmatota archaeon]
MAGVTLKDIEAAWKVVNGQVRHTPVKRSSSLSEMTGGDLWLKFENFQRTGSFKVRGALNKIHSLTPDERRRGVVAASAGNHAQGVAYAAAKAAATRGYGAEVHLVGRDYQEAFEHAKAFCAKQKAIFVHAYNDPAIMAGQGTLGMEIHQDLPDLDVVLVPIGGGGLISGVATALKALNPKIRVIGVQAEGASTIAPSLEKGKPVALAETQTMADGIAVRSADPGMLQGLRRVVDQVVTVSEAEIAAAILFLLERAKTVAEGAGAVSLAAAMHGKVNLKGKKACVVVSGGNIDMNLVGRIIQRGLVKEGRIAVLETVISDRPGSLAAFLALLAEHKASVIDLHHDRDRTDIALNRTGLEVHVEVRGRDHIEELRKALRAAGYEAKIGGP